MKQILLFLFIAGCGIPHAFSQEVNIIPKPVYADVKQGSFEISAKTKIYYNAAAAERSAKFLQSFVAENYGFTPAIQQGPKPATGILFILDNAAGKESYELTVGKNAVTIKGDAAGLFYGLQSLLQIMPLDNNASVALPLVTVKDKPRFGYRGAMLDCGRYFFTPGDVKRFIDLMAYYKLNTFHWHLTEDAGWRIEIKKYPLLTQIGAWRRGTQSAGNPESFDRLPHGGFYTQKQIKDIVKYAGERNINIIPEVDMPGHTLSVLAAYPEVSCTGGPFKVLEYWGIQKDVLCPGNEKTYEMIEGILDEVLEMFPSKIIHIGGDEAPKDRWKACSKCQAKIRSENLKDEHELQSYFVKRVGKYLQDKGRKMLGWDEIMEGGLAPNAMVMSWRGVKGGIEAARMHHEVVMAPTDYMYLDYYQAKPEGEPVNIGGNLPLEKVYNYEPLSPEIPQENHKYIVGVQGNIWMEFIHSVPKTDYMGFPRLLAVAETGWSPKEKDYTGFLRRLSYNLQWLDKMNVNFRIPDPIGLKDIASESKQFTVELQTPVHEAGIYYTLNGEDPMEKGILYTAPVKIDLSSGQPVELKCIVRTKTGRVSGVRKATYTLKKL
ncbi:MAG: family 20 glycosylhydrolase [Niabella sp.]